MVVGVLGAAGGADARARAVEADGARIVRRPAAPDSAAALVSWIEALDAVFIATPASGHYRIAEAAAKRGVHIFLERPPQTSVRECAALVRLAEEAGVEVGVSRPLRFHAAFAALPAGWRPRLIALEQPLAGNAAWPAPLAEALDVCCALAQSSSIRRIDAEAVRGRGARPEAVAFGLRFHSGTYAQVSLRCDGAGRLFAAGPDLHLEVDLDGSAVRVRQGGDAFEPAAAAAPPPIEAETRAFLAALRAGQPAPVSALDALHTMRLVERLMQQLR